MSAAGGSVDPSLKLGQHVEKGAYDGRKGQDMTTPLKQLPAEDPAAHAAPKRSRDGCWFHFSSILTLVVAPWIVFIVVTFCFTVFAFNLAGVAWVVDVAGVLAAFMCLFLYYNTKVTGPMYMYLFWLILIAVIAGTMTGLWFDAQFMSQYWAYRKLVTYNNVIPTEPADTHQDAGLISFSESTRVDTRRSLGRRAQDGFTYCVAPILDESQATRVEYWAVGVNCCESLWNFMCDDSLNPAARAGLVMMQAKWHPNGPDYHKFLDAVKQASAVYDLMPAEHPLLLRWVEDPAAVQDQLFRNGWCYLVFAYLIYVVWSLLLGTILHISTRRVEAPKNFVS
eukprot:gnl/TRDRNA2_/TRDRNA2_182717_c0_seq1.p1 gnl/TRDRNA2_/TRDRNA2_182717_c0~~gnl/TRDRNA2_/TRDRNA2_182717_c0_seq1.p1  ORF type:complete len:338 (-),score=45.27 gnl/TRDRNA2_/TRDRNA2_182717_c0_seq1:107-1120(-)